MQEINVLDDIVVPEPSAIGLKELVKIAQHLQGVEAQIEHHEKVVKDLKDLRNEIQMRVLPDAMAAIGIPKFSLDDGFSIEVKPFVNASIPSKTSIEKERDPEVIQALIKRKEACLNWLTDNKAGDLIKSIVKVDFDRGGKVEGLLNMLRRWKIVKDVSVDENVHNGTLLSFVKERAEAGRPVPTDLFNVTEGRIAKVIPPAKPKKAKEIV